MGCTKTGHSHQWPTKGVLTIQRCEVRCNFCTGNARFKDWKYAWFLRRHVRAIHVKKGEFKGLRVDAGWNDENPRIARESRGGTSKVKQEPLGSDEGGYTVPQTNGELIMGPTPEFVSQPRSDGGEYPGYDNTDYSMMGLEYGNLNAQFPTLAGEEVFGMEHTQIAEDFQEWIDTTTGFDGNYQEEEELPANVNPITGENIEPPTENPIPASSAGRFFMEDVDTPEDDEDDMPLASRMENYNFNYSAPLSTSLETHRNMIDLLNGVAKDMEQLGADPRDMLPALDTFIRSMQQDYDRPS